MMRYLFIVFLLVSYPSFSQFQSESISGMYWNNYAYFNPAMTSVRNKYEANAIRRNKWDKVYSSPNSLFLNYGMNFAEKHGIGATYLNETNGYRMVNRAKVHYNYQLRLKNEQKLVFGTSLSFNRGHWTPDIMQLADLIYVEPIHSVCVDLGIAYYGKKLTAGISSTQLPVYRSTNLFQVSPHYFGNARYELTLTPRTNFIILETKIRTDLVKYSQDFNVGYHFKHFVEGGIGYRTSDAILFNLTGIFAKNYRVGYLYEMALNTVEGVSRGTHEIALSFRFAN